MESASLFCKIWQLWTSCIFGWEGNWYLPENQFRLELPWHCSMLLYFADMKTDIELKWQDISYSLYITVFYGHLILCKNIVDNCNLDVHKPDHDGETILHYAAWNGSYKLVAYFVELWADLDLKTNDGSNCLHISAFWGHLDLCKALIKNHKLDLHIADNYGWTALHYSVRKGSYKLVKIFWFGK